MRIAFALLMVAHASIHLMGFARAFELAPLAQLQVPISRPVGVLWLAAAVLLLTAVAFIFLAPRWFWLIGLISLVVSQTALITSWSDARYGTLPNFILLAAAIYGAYAWGPLGIRADYEQLARDGLARAARAAQVPTISEADLAPLPPLVQRYLRFVGVVGTPRIQGFHAQMTGRIRSSATAPWMPFVAEQYSFFDPPRRYFWMKATRSGLPLDGLHAYGETDASMRIRLFSLLPVVTLSGPEMMRPETVTLLDDMCILAPGRLIDPAIQWRTLDAHRVEATYTNGPHTIVAVLVFDDTGALVNFWSDDRPALAEDGKTQLPGRWSTPILNYRTRGPYHIASRGEGRYATADGEYAYIELNGIRVNTTLPPAEALDELSPSAEND